MMVGTLFMDKKAETNCNEEMETIFGSRAVQVEISLTAAQV
jgi:hypothetical protein